MAANALLFSVEAFGLQCQAVRDAGVHGQAQAQLVQHLNALLLCIHPVEKAKLHDMVSALPFLPQEISLLRSSIDALKDGGSRNFQDWTSLHSFLTQQQVDAFLKLNSQDAKLWALLTWAWNLGLRSPSMGTFQTLTAIWSIMVHNASATSHEKKTMLDRLKLMWRQREGPRPAVVIGNLPETPALLHKLVPHDWWQNCVGCAFADCTWVQTDVVQFGALTRSIPMRTTRMEIRDAYLGNRGGSAPQQAPAVPGLAPVGAPESATAVVALLQQLLGGASSRPEVPFLQMQTNRPRLQDPAPLEECPLTVLRGPDSAPDSSGQNLVTTAAETAASARVSLQESTLALAEHAANTSKAPKGKAKPKAKAKAKAEGTATKAAAKAKATTKAKAKAKGKAKAKAKAKVCRAMPATERARSTARPHGCAKCRNKPGCTPSCWASATTPS